MNYYDTQHFFWEFVRDKSILSECIRKWGSQEARPFPKVNIDILELTALFRTLGFTLESIDNETMSDSEDRSTEIRLEFTCSRTGLKSTLTKQMDRCTCPTSAELTDSRSRPYEENEYVCLPEEDLLPYLPPSYFVLTGNLLKIIFKKFFITRKGTPEPLECSKNKSFETSTSSMESLKTSENESPTSTKSRDFIVDVSTSPRSGSTSEEESTDSSELTTSSEEDSFQSTKPTETSEEEHSDVELGKNNYSSQGDTSVSPKSAQLPEEESETRANSSSKNGMLLWDAIHYKTMEIATWATSALLSTAPTKQVAPVVEYSNQAQTGSPTEPSVVKKCSPSRIPILRKSKFGSSSSLPTTDSKNKHASVALINNSPAGDGYQLF